MEGVYRSTCRAQVTKLCNTIADYLKTFDTISYSEVTDPSAVESEISVYVDRLKNAHKNLKAADEAMRPSVKQEDFEKECETILEYDDKAVTTIAQLEHVLRTYFKPSAELKSTKQNVGEDTLATENGKSGMFGGVKLKACELKKFDGNFENWLPFWELFKRAVHDNKNLSVAAKFNFLSETLKGKAAASIAGFTPTEKCYSEAIALLQEEYGNSDKIVEKFIQKLMNIKPVQSSADVVGLRQLYNEVTSTMRSLIAFQISSSQYDIMVKSVLLKAIPATMRVQFYRSADMVPAATTLLSSSIDNDNENNKTSGTDGEQLNNLLKFIKVELEALEKSELSERDRKRDTRERREHQRSPGTVMGLFSGSKNQQQCVFCKKTSHAAKNCNSNLSIEQKKNILRREGRCFRCSNKNHSSKFCKAQWVACDGCSGRHITSMCEKQVKGNQERSDRVQRREPNMEASEKLASGANAAALNTFGLSRGEIFLQTAKAIVKDIQGCESVMSRLIMDNGSQRTYISEKLFYILNIPTCGVERLQIIAFGDKTQNKKATNCSVVEISLQSQYSEKAIKIKAIVVPNICVDILPVPNINDTKFKCLTLELADNIVSGKKLVEGINILIGQDNYWKFSTGETKNISERLVAVRTFFGWTIQGCNEQPVEKNLTMTCLAEASEEMFDLTKFWSLESVGINDSKGNENNVIEKTLSTIEMSNDRYVVKLPWKMLSGNLNANKEIALGRLRGLTNKLFKNNDKLIEYDQGIRELVKSGVAEQVNDLASGQRVYYMPHKPVYREDKATTKTRIVFDASSSESGVMSLNDHLSAGDNLVADLLKTLLRFRSNAIAITADIEKAFLQISISEEDRDSHRFFWYESMPKLGERLPKIVQFRMTRVTFGVTSSPFLLSATIQKHLTMSTQQYGQICDKLKKSFYVDDLVMSVSSRKEAQITFTKASEIMAAAQFNLRKWNTNDTVLQNYFRNNKANDVDSQKVLGINWCTAYDEISVNIESSISYIQSLRPTKRNVMKSMAKIYDPLGMLGPFTVRIKIVLQNIWKENVEWDQTLSGEIMREFQCWQDELNFLINFNLQRCLSQTDGIRTELHIFADASPKAYGAVAYIRQITASGAIVTNFICSKNRVSPIEKSTRSSELTLPKLELTAALTAARLKQFLMEALDFQVHSSTMWTDSAIALNWINGQGKQLKPYVKARVNEIVKYTNMYDWRHCQGKNNPADLLTRGVKAKVLISSILWKNGPAWLGEKESNWPEELIVEKSASLLVHLQKSTNVLEQEPLLVLENYSRLKRLLRVTAYIMRFIRNLKTILINKKQRIQMIKNELSASEIIEAESYWIKYSQQREYREEVIALEKQQPIPSGSKLVSLNPVLIDGILRIKSRLPSTYDGNSNPIILPKHSHFSELVVLDAHHAVLHGGVNSVLCHIRKKFWILRARQLIKTVLRHCVICKRLHGKNANEPWTTLPAERVTTSRPFQTTGVDFAGPLYAKAHVNGEVRKVYVMLLTCAAVRAVHLELVTDLSSKSCIDALRRFMARRGVPEVIMSDNAKTFKRTNLELKKLSDLLANSEVQQIAAHQNITWKFIPERAAWWGGFWERLVRSVKNCLKAAVGKASLTIDDLTTLLAEIESVVNARPLTYISSDHNDLEPLTPSHFLTNSKTCLLQTDFRSDGSSLAKAWELRQTLIKRYLKRWRVEYLQQLRTIHHNKCEPARSVKVGDVVLLHEDNKPRLLWRLAVVHQVYQGRDGRVRSCDIRLQNNQILKRPIQLLYPLEIASSLAGAEDVEN